MMKRITTLTLCLVTALVLMAQGDPRSISMTGIPVEGVIDSMDVRLRAAGLTQWGSSEDGEDFYYRGKFYGIRAKFTVSLSPTTRLVRSASVSIGPYRTKGMIGRNFSYFLHKLQQEHGEMTQRGDSYYIMTDYGSVRLSQVDNGDGSTDIRVFYFASGAFYKDAYLMGLHGNVQEVVTENAVAEDQFLHFSEDGRLDNPDLAERHYDGYGYLLSGKMAEKEGHSDVSYTYSSSRHLLRRTLTNPVAGITYVHEYTYNQTDEVQSENQKVYDKTGECIMTIQLNNNYLTRDDMGNWTSNQLTLTYWEKGMQSQRTQVLQKRTIAYWE